MATSPRSALFPTVFSPSKYGADDALMLNSLQWVMAGPGFGRPYRGSLCSSNGAASRLFAQASGSELEADYLTLHFANRPNDLFFGEIHWVLVISATDPDEVAHAIALLKMFLPGFVQKCGGDSLLCAQYSAVYNSDWNKQDEGASDVTREVMRLRERLYRRPRAVAFMSGMHGRLGEQSLVHSLSDDLCKRILELSFVE